MKDQQIAIYAGTKIPYNLKESIEAAVTTGSYLNQSDFIRDAIREKLEREGFTKIKPGGEKG